MNCLLEQKSLVQISAQVGISHETIYLHVYADKAAGGSLYQQLRCQKSARNAMPVAGIAEAKSSAGGRSVSPPTQIATPSQVGHWEGDTVIGAAHKQVGVPLVEHKSDYADLAKVKNKTSDLVSSAIMTKLKPLAPHMKTMTFDNGEEFAEHSRIDTVLQSTTYFADPFVSWQHGSNDNFNGLPRQYIRKKRPISTVGGAELRMIQD